MFWIKVFNKHVQNFTNLNLNLTKMNLSLVHFQPQLVSTISAFDPPPKKSFWWCYWSLYISFENRHSFCEDFSLSTLYKPSNSFFISHSFRQRILLIHMTLGLYISYNYEIYIKYYHQEPAGRPTDHLNV